MMSTAGPGSLLTLILAVVWFCTAIASDVYQESISFLSEVEPDPGCTSEDDDALKCRVTAVDTMYITAKGTVASREQTSCIPIIDDEETDDILNLDLPDDIADQNRKAIDRGDLYMSISGASILGEDVLLPEYPAFLILEPPELRRQLETFTSGDRTMAVIRVSTTDKSPKFSKNALLSGLFGNGINMKTQYEACSFGKLTWKLAPAGLVDVRINQPIADFTSGTSIVTAATKQLKAEMGLSSLSSLADKVIYVVPEGTGSWIASAGVGSWRAQ